MELLSKGKELYSKKKDSLLNHPMTSLFLDKLETLRGSKALQMRGPGKSGALDAIYKEEGLAAMKGNIPEMLEAFRQKHYPQNSLKNVIKNHPGYIDPQLTALAPPKPQ